MTPVRQLRRGDTIELDGEEYEVEYDAISSEKFDQAGVTLLREDLSVMLYTASYRETVNRVKEGPQ